MNVNNCVIWYGGLKKKKNPEKNSEVGGWVKSQLRFFFVCVCVFVFLYMFKNKIR